MPMPMPKANAKERKRSRGRFPDSKKEGDSRIGREEVKHLAWLARIKLSNKEIDAFAEQLSQILEYFRKIDEVDTEGVEPTYHVLDLTNVFRKDEPRTFPAEEVLRNVPEKRGGYVKAPRMG
ncbi:MAG: Asp-tRNA(Asn)/Glu-tRNA(Gln) amidotransferase subunit GatC [Candidatus Bathyarchaeia archaeon]